MKKILNLILLLAYVAAFPIWADTTSTTTTTTTTVAPANANPTVVPIAVPVPVAVPPGPSEADQKIIAAIYEKFGKSAALVGTQLTVKSENGFVTISGRVTAQSQADDAVTQAKTIIGVKDVKSEIIVTTKPTGPLPEPVNY